MSYAVQSQSQLALKPPSASAPAPAPAPTTTNPDPKQRFITAVRGWIHMDNLSEGFSRQASNARQVKATHEADAICLMKQLGYAGSTVQVSGATLQLVRRRTPGTLTWGYLEREVPVWATRAGLSPTQSQSLLHWLHEHRDEKETEVLKKTVVKGGL